MLRAIVAVVYLLLLAFVIDIIHFAASKADFSPLVRGTARFRDRDLRRRRHESRLGTNIVERCNRLQDESESQAMSRHTQENAHETQRDRNFNAERSAGKRR